MSEILAKQVHDIYHPKDRECSWDCNDLKVVKLFAERITDLRSEIAKKDEFIDELDFQSQCSWCEKNNKSREKLDK